MFFRGVTGRGTKVARNQRDIYTRGMPGDFWIGEWHVQPSINRISRANDVVRVEPKVMQVLVCLAARPGEVVTPGQAVVTLINPDDLWIRADVEETYIDRVRVGDHIRIRLPSGVELNGTVFYRGADASFATQRDVSRTKRDIKTFEIRLRADNTERRLAVGMTAYVLLQL